MKTILKIVGVIVGLVGLYTLLPPLALLFAGYGASIISLVPGAAILALGIYCFRQGQATGMRASDKFGEGFRYHFLAGRTGIAICPQRSVLKLKEKSRVKEYAFADIRTWESNLQTGGMVVHGGSSLIGASNVGAANMGQAMANKRASGFFVQVRDIDHPKWRIEMFNPKDQARWMEIMTQCVNES